jgi:hypothetical protein
VVPAVLVREHVANRTTIGPKELAVLGVEPVTFAALSAAVDRIAAIPAG